MKELKAAFVEAVDDYRAYCEAEGAGTTINGYIKQALDNQLKIAH